MERGTSSAFLCAELCLQEVRHMRPENHDFRKMPIKHTEKHTQEHSGLLYESPGGNQVDGLPPVAHLVKSQVERKQSGKRRFFGNHVFLQEKLALRGSLAVTWLTVYRRLQVIPTQLTLPARRPGTFFFTTDACSRFSLSLSIRSR